MSERMTDAEFGRIRRTPYVNSALRGENAAEWSRLHGEAERARAAEAELRAKVERLENLVRDLRDWMDLKPSPTARVLMAQFAMLAGRVLDAK